MRADGGATVGPTEPNPEGVLVPVYRYRKHSVAATDRMVTIDADAPTYLRFADDPDLFRIVGPETGDAGYEVVAMDVEDEVDRVLERDAETLSWRLGLDGDLLRNAVAGLLGEYDLLLGVAR